MKGRGLVPTPSSTRILFGDERTAGIGEGDREALLLEASADANVERCEKVLCVLSPEGRRWMYSNMEPSGDLHRRSGGTASCPTRWMGMS